MCVCVCVCVQLSAYSLELLSAVVVGLSQIAPQLPSPPPSVWEQAVYDALVAGADKCQIRVSDTHTQTHTHTHRHHGRIVSNLASL